jgi:hypothetical protein
LVRTTLVVRMPAVPGAPMAGVDLAFQGEKALGMSIIGASDVHSLMK